MDWQKILYPGIWCILFVIAGFQIWIIKLISDSNEGLFLIVYYGCAIAALIALCFLILNVAKFITEGQSAK